MPTSLTNDLKRLRELKLAKDKAKKTAESLDAKFKEVQATVLERMESMGVEQMKVGGVLFVPTHTTYASIQDRTEFVEWAQANDPELIEYTERAQVLNQLVRERLDNGQPLPEGCGFYVREGISQRAA